MAEDEQTTSKGPPELAIDSREQGGFIAWFKNLPQNPQCIRFLDRKGFYSVHGEDAVYVARKYYKTTAVVKHLGPAGAAGLDSVTLNRNLFETALRDILLESTDRTVELYEGSGASWTCTRTASPGRLSAFEEELFKSGQELTDSPVVVAVNTAVKEGQREVGVAYVDAVNRRLGVTQFTDDESLGELEALLVQLGAKEAVVVKDDKAAVASSGDTEAQGGLGKRLADLLDRCGAMCSYRPRSFFSVKHLESDLAKLVKGGAVEQHAAVLERGVACGALAAVLSFCEVLGDASGHGRWELGLHDIHRFMRLDAAAQRALNVFPSRADAQSSFSLYGLLNRCRTAMGKRRLRVWLKQPLVSCEEISARLDVVEALVQDAELRSRLRDTQLRGLPDVQRLTRKLDGRRGVTLADLCALYRCSARLPLIEEALRGCEGPHTQLLCTKFADPLAWAHDKERLVLFEELVEAAVDLDKVPDEYLIAPAYDPRLERLRDAKESAEAALERLAGQAASDLGLELGKTIKLEWHKAANQRTRCLRITQKEEKAVRGKLQAKYKTLSTTKDGVRFTTKSMEAEAMKLQEASAQYEEVQRELVEQVVKVAHTFVEVWDQMATLLAELDVLAGFADLAATAPAPYTRPTLQDASAPDARILLRGCRHPCVEAQEGVDFIKNDCDLRRQEAWFLIITGPNMGGKSTYIRQIGVAVLMAQVGCFVPADEAVIATRDAIFARVGAGDCQQRGVSTFMAEMLETAAILKGATSSSLVIIDELGRGTSTYDGFGLAWAISEHLLQVVGAPTLFATHFHELTELANTQQSVQNLHVSTVVDPASGKLTMLYQILAGACDQSFGIQVAESANFPAEVVALAKAHLAKLEGTEAAGLKAVSQGGKRKLTDRPDAVTEEAVKRARTFLSDLASLQLPASDTSDDAWTAVLQQAEQLLSGLEADAAQHPGLAALVA